MVDKKKTVSHSASWWETARHEYIAKNEMLFGSHPDWEYICPYDFYRALFPEGFLEQKGVMRNWDEPGGGRPNGIILQITNRKHEVKTKSGKVRMVADVERYTLTDDLDAIMERVGDSNDKNETVFCAPVSYFGKNRSAANARFLHAFTIDLDGVGTEQLGNILKQIRNGYDQSLPLWTSLPQPTFIVNSGTGLHLYYLLDEPVPLVPHIVPFLQTLKEKLTDYVWRDTTSTLEEKQFQGIYQSFRMVGTPTKLNGRRAESKLKDRYEAVAFVHNGADGKPYRCGIEYLLKYAGAKNRGKDREMLLELKSTGGRTPIAQAKEKWPEWYNRRIIEGAPAGRWVCKRDLYDWWLGQIEVKATDHHRYWCLNALAAYADKCGVPYDELERDALALVPHMESLTVREDNHFTEEDALAAISSYGDGIIHKLHRDRIERRTQIEIPGNKRNGRKQKVHLMGARAIQQINDEVNGTNWRDGNGRKPKCDEIRAFASEHQDMNHSEIARALGVSRPTVIKWLKDVPKDATEPEKPKPDDLYELYNPAMVELRAALDQYSSSANDRGYLSPTIAAAGLERVHELAVDLDLGHAAVLGGAGPELVQAAAGAECRRGRQAQHLAAEAPFGPGLGPVIAAAPVELEAAPEHRRRAVGVELEHVLAQRRRAIGAGVVALDLVCKSDGDVHF